MSRQCLKVLRAGQSLSCVAWHPDGRHLAAASLDRSVRTWDVMSGRPQLTMSAWITPMIDLGYSPDGKRLAGGSSDGGIQLLEQRDRLSGAEPTGSPSTACARSHSRRTVAASWWPASNIGRRCGRQGPPQSPKVSPGGSRSRVGSGVRREGCLAGGPRRGRCGAYVGCRQRSANARVSWTLPGRPLPGRQPGQPTDHHRQRGPHGTVVGRSGRGGVALPERAPRRGVQRRVQSRRTLGSQRWHGRSGDPVGRRQTGSAASL